MKILIFIVFALLASQLFFFFHTNRRAELSVSLYFEDEIENAFAVWKEEYNMNAAYENIEEELYRKQIFIENYKRI